VGFQPFVLMNAALLKHTMLRQILFTSTLYTYLFDNSNHVQRRVPHEDVQCRRWRHKEPGLVAE
jgi:hypothetical protein